MSARVCDESKQLQLHGECQRSSTASCKHAVCLKALLKALQNALRLPKRQPLEKVERDRGGDGGRERESMHERERGNK